VSEIDVSEQRVDDGWDCLVSVRDSGETRHQVHVADADLARLDPGATDPHELVSASFAFLLERESNRSILREFDLMVIGRYFPEYEGEITRRMGT
jgi:hypothetical protein